MTKLPDFDRRITSEPESVMLDIACEWCRENFYSGEEAVMLVDNVYVHEDCLDDYLQAYYVRGKVYL